MRPRLLALVVSGSALLAATAAVAQSQPVVVELFTSQGCSSCPPADALLKRYADRRDVVALTLPVDYWDYLGWRDTLANAKFSERQRAYARARGDGAVYTPQVVVNGLAHAVGSHGAEIDRAIERTSKMLAQSRVSLKAWSEHGMVVIEAGASSDTAMQATGTVWLAVVQSRVDVAVRHGENRGKALSYYNVVRGLTPVGMWSGKASTLRLPQNAVASGPDERGAILLQHGSAGPIVAATWITP